MLTHLSDILARLEAERVLRALDDRTLADMGFERAAIGARLSAAAQDDARPAPRRQEQRGALLRAIWPRRSALRG